MNPIPDHVLYGRSPIMREVRLAVQSVSSASVPVLLYGERGTGKKTIGQEIHRCSPWSSGPFTRVDTTSAALRSSSRGDGHNEGNALSAFMFPVRSETAVLGTLFIDDVGELSPVLQANLLDFFPADVHFASRREPINLIFPRILCSTHRNLSDDVAAGRFRVDLFYRINVVAIHLPRLRDRREDIPDLANYFYEASCLQQGQHCPSIPDALIHAFSEYYWPGNIRELESCIDAYVSSKGKLASIELLLGERTSTGGSRFGEPLKPEVPPLRSYTRRIMEEAEREMILRALNETQWNRKEAAKALHISYHTLLHKLKQTALDTKYKRRESGGRNSIGENPLP